ncbi:TonB-dependent receptor family protein [Helicobacter cetorum]|uniref:TonB-dependent receptor family protein n=1 Tax=Helicobacter cetorum TaxID=138563 RepID=UPI001F31244C
MLLVLLGMSVMQAKSSKKSYTLSKVQALGMNDVDSRGYGGIDTPKNWQSSSVRNFAGSRSIISHKQITQTANQSVEEALQNVPGIQIRNFNGTGIEPSISVRGFGAGAAGHSDTGMILMNGVPIYADPYSAIRIPLMPINFLNVDRIDVIKGGSSVQYGPNTFGGVINVITKEIPKKWVNEVAERTTFWGRARNSGFVSTQDKPINKSLANNMLFDTYLKSGGMINKHFGVQIQADWLKGQGFRYNSPTDNQNYMLEGVWKINANNSIKAYYQYYSFFFADPGSLSIEAYNTNRFQNNRPNNTKSGRSKRFGIVYQNYFGTSEKLNGDFSFTYYTQDLSRDFKFDTNFLNVNSNPENGPVYTDDNYNGFAVFQHPRRFVFNAFEPKLHLNVKTGNIKQTFTAGMRFFASDLYFPPALRDTTTCKAGWTPLKGTIYNESLQDLEDNGVSVKAGVDTMGKSVQELQQEGALGYNTSDCSQSGYQWNYAFFPYQRLNNNFTAVYLSDKIDLFDGKLVITPGIRYTFLNYHYHVKMLNPNYQYDVEDIHAKGSDDYIIRDYPKQNNEFNPAVSIAYKPISNWVLYFNYQRSFIPPQQGMAAFYNGFYRQFYTQTFNEIEAGSRYSYKDKLSFNSNYFITFAHDYNSGGYTSVPIDGRSQGVELELYYAPIRGLQFHAAYTYIDALITNNGASNPFFVGIVNSSYEGHYDSFNIKGKRFPYVSPNQFVFDARYTYKNTTIGLSSFFYSRSYSSMLNSDKSKQVCGYIEPLWGINYQCNNVGMLPWYWVWNIQISQVLWQSGRHKITASLQVNNIFNMKYYFRGIGTSPTGRQPGPGRSITCFINYQF